MQRAICYFAFAIDKLTENSAHTTAAFASKYQSALDRNGSERISGIANEWRTFIRSFVRSFFARVARDLVRFGEAAT